jgi:hypothetical protein
MQLGKGTKYSKAEADFMTIKAKDARKKFYERVSKCSTY